MAASCHCLLARDTEKLEIVFLTAVIREVLDDFASARAVMRGSLLEQRNRLVAVVEKAERGVRWALTTVAT
jgi:hypothetical protein